MTDKQIERIKKLGLNPADFEKKPISDDERVSILEDALAELCEVIFGD